MRDIDPHEFTYDIQNSALGSLYTKNKNVEELVVKYNSVLSELLDKHAHEKTLNIKIRSDAPWYTDEIKAAKHECRKAERKWRNTKLTARDLHCCL